MPFSQSGEYPYKYVSVGISDWVDYKNENADYNYIIGILLDTRHLIDSYAMHNDDEIMALSKLIEESLESFKKSSYYKS